MPAFTGDEMSTLAAIAYEFDGVLKDRPHPSIFDSDANAFFAGERWGAVATRMSPSAQHTLRAMFKVAQELYHTTAHHPPKKFREVLEELQRRREEYPFSTHPYSTSILVNTLESLAQLEEREDKENRCPTCHRPM